jgi:sugar O-acyltransferase (sialic acid O-acetyltransferase NeuD family)
MAGDGRPLLVLGTHLLAAELADLIADIPEWELAGYVENLDRGRCRMELANKPIRWIDEIRPLVPTHHAICGISATQRWKFVEQVESLGMPFATLVHPLSHISRTSCIGIGCIISPGVIVASNTTLGRQVFVNRGVLIGHHTVVEDYVSLQPGANIAGACRIGERTYIGMGAVVIDHVSIGRNCMVGAGSVVTRNLPDNVQAVGIPARIVKQNIGDNS